MRTPAYAAARVIKISLRKRGVDITRIERNGVPRHVAPTEEVLALRTELKLLNKKNSWESLCETNIPMSHYPVANKPDTKYAYKTQGCPIFQIGTKKILLNSYPVKPTIPPGTPSKIAPIKPNMAIIIRTNTSSPGDLHGIF